MGKDRIKLDHGRINGRTDVINRLVHTSSTFYKYPQWIYSLSYQLERKVASKSLSYCQDSASRKTISRKGADRIGGGDGPDVVGTACTPYLNLIVPRLGR